MNDKWSNNELQFARLLCELVANCENLEIELVSRSMDLPPWRVQELFDRADEVWEKAKCQQLATGPIRRRKR